MDVVHVLIAGRSDVTCIVVSRIVERSGFKATCAKPDEAALLLAELRPDIVVLDGGVDNRECDGLMRHIAASRGPAGEARPAVLLLSNRHAGPSEAGGCVDAVVAKPITPERIQPVIAQLIAGAALRARAGIRS